LVVEGIVGAYGHAMTAPKTYLGALLDHEGNTVLVRLLDNVGGTRLHAKSVSFASGFIDVD
jgi:hypothetical protein